LVFWLVREARQRSWRVPFQEQNRLTALTLALLALAPLLRAPLPREDRRLRQEERPIRRMENPSAGTPSAGLPSWGRLSAAVPRSCVRIGRCAGGFR